MGIALAALPFLIVMLVRSRPERRAWVALALALVVFLPIACDEVHFGTYAQALLVIPYAACVAWLLRLTEPGWRRSRVRSCGLSCWSARCSGPMAWPMRCRRRASRPPATTVRSTRPAPVLTRLAGGVPKTVLTFTDYAPSLLYDTPLRVLSIPNHRPQPGFATTYRILSALDPRRPAPISPATASTGSCCARARPSGASSPMPATTRRRSTGAWSTGTPPAWLRRRRCRRTSPAG